MVAGIRVENVVDLYVRPFFFGTVPQTGTA